MTKAVYQFTGTDIRCGGDVIDTAHSVCSGKRSCEKVIGQTFRSSTSCPNYITPPLRYSYQCWNGMYITYDEKVKH